MTTRNFKKSHLNGVKNYADLIDDAYTRGQVDEQTRNKYGTKKEPPFRSSFPFKIKTV